MDTHFRDLVGNRQSKIDVVGTTTIMATVKVSDVNWH